MEEARKKADDKMTAEVEKRKAAETAAAERRQLEDNRRRDEIEFRIRQRKENRVKSMQEMEERTKAIGSSRTRLHKDLQQRFKDVQEKTQMNQNELANIKNRLDPESEAQLLSVSQNKYEDILRAKREELRKKRGALELNNDLDIDPDFIAPRHPRSGSNHVSYKSKLHQDLRNEKNDAKAQLQREYQDKVEKNTRIKNYSKNVKEMYMPTGKERHKSSNAERKFIEMGIQGGNGLPAQRSEMDIPVDAYGAEVPKKKIAMKRRSGTADDRELAI